MIIPSLIFRQKDYLTKEYVLNARSAAEIGKEHGVSNIAILYWIKKHDIPRRNVSETRRVKYWRGPTTLPRRARPMTPEERSAYRQLLFLALPECSDKERRTSQAWQRDHPDYNCQKLKRYRKQHPERYKNYDRKRSSAKVAYMRERRRTNIPFKIACVLRGRINAALKGKNKSASTLKLLGCSVASFKIYLESKWETGMAWGNYGRYPGWQIDHIMPCAIFDLTKPEHQRRCFHFSNMQPMWAVDNLSKNRTPVTNQFHLL